MIWIYNIKTLNCIKKFDIFKFLAILLFFINVSIFFFKEEALKKELSPQRIYGNKRRIWFNKVERIVKTMIKIT